MNFSQMQERLRVELLRRISRGTLSVSLPARQTGFKPSHLPNFLRSPRHLSLDGVDWILASRHRGAADLPPNLHAMRKDSRLKLRYADFLLDRIVLGQHNRAFPVELMELGPGESTEDRIVGRLILILSEH